MRTTKTLPDGSKVTTTTTSYTRGPSTLKEEHSYRLPDGSRQTVSRTRNQVSQGRQIGGSILGAILLAALAIGAGKLVWSSLTHTSYKDGRAWALTWESGPLGPEPWIGCNRTDMVSSGFVYTGEYRKVPGSGHPHDNYQRWLAGCESARSYYLSQLKSP